MSEGALKLLSRGEVALRLSCSKRTVSRLERRGLLRGVRLSQRLVRFDERQVDELIKRATE